MIFAKPLRIRFDKVNGFIRVYDGTTYLTLFDSEKIDVIYNSIRYLIELNSGMTYVISHNYAKVKVYSYDFLPLGKTVTFHNVIIHTKSFLNKGQNHYYYNIFLENGSYQLFQN